MSYENEQRSSGPDIFGEQTFLQVLRRTSAFNTLTNFGVFGRFNNVLIISIQLWSAS